MRPIYNSVRIGNSRDIKSVDRDPIYAQVMANGTCRAYSKPVATNNGQPQCNSTSTRSNVLMSLTGHGKQTAHKQRQSLLNVPFVERVAARDIRSCERDYAAETENSALSSSVVKGQKKRTLNTNENMNQLIIENERSDEPIPTIEVTAPHLMKPTKSTSDSTECYEEDEHYGSQDDDDEERTLNDKSEQDLLASLDETNHEQAESEESSKVKIALMQKQLQHLTDLVQNALINRDFSQLAVASSQLSLKPTMPIRNSQQNAAQQRRTKIEINALNKKTCSIKSELVNLKKMQEDFSSTFGESIRSFVNQLNVNKKFIF